MPVYLRRIEPVNVGRHQGRNEAGAFVNEPALVGSQEEACNRTMANIIRQLASLGRHANDIFGETLANCMKHQASQSIETDHPKFRKDRGLRLIQIHPIRI